MEHVIATQAASGFRAEGRLVLAERPPAGAGPGGSGLASVRYDLHADARWRVTSLTVVLVSASGERTLQLESDAAGHWSVDGIPRPDLEDCTDIDISQTPLTNTLPIRRLNWTAAASHDLAVVYVRVPELTAERAQQRYTLIGPGTGPAAAVYRYESGTFRADLPADSDGFVLDYPGLWRRIRPGQGQPY
jgi:hypothetical protein